jgi:hypothetical protein
MLTALLICLILLAPVSLVVWLGLCAMSRDCDDYTLHH